MKYSEVNSRLIEIENENRKIVLSNFIKTLDGIEDDITERVVFKNGTEVDV